MEIFNVEFEFFHAYLISFCVGFFFAVGSAVLSGVFGGDGGVDHDVGGAHLDPGLHLDPGAVHFSPLSPTIIATFLAVFGGTGMICLRVFNMSDYGSIPVSIVAALGVSFLFFLLLEWIFRKTQGSTNIDATQLVGTRADVITPIPVNGVGEIAYVAKGSRQNSPARSADGTAIASPTEVEIVRVVGGSFIVRRIEPGEDGGPQAAATSAAADGQ